MEQILNTDFILGHMNYWLFVILMMTGLYIVVARGNLLKKIVGLNLFQVAVFMLYISTGKVAGGTHSNRDCRWHSHDFIGVSIDR